MTREVVQIAAFDTTFFADGDGYPFPAISTPPSSPSTATPAPPGNRGAAIVVSLGNTLAATRRFWEDATALSSVAVSGSTSRRSRRSRTIAGVSLRSSGVVGHDACLRVQMHSLQQALRSGNNEAVRRRKDRGRFAVTDPSRRGTAARDR